MQMSGTPKLAQGRSDLDPIEPELLGDFIFRQSPRCTAIEQVGNFSQLSVFVHENHSAENGTSSLHPPRARNQPVHLFILNIR